MGNASPPDPGHDPSPPQAQTGLGNFWSELKRRKVVRVAITYAVVAWLIIQIAATTFQGFGIPIWAFRFVMLCIILGFPFAVIFAWAFELTPDGIVLTKSSCHVPHPEQEGVTHNKKRNWMAYGIGALIPTVMFGGLALFFYITLSPQNNYDLNLVQESPSETDEIFEKSIAVLPLENMSPDPENAFFADGVQEDILTNLSKVRELSVISRSSTLQYRNPERNLKRIGDELGVRYIVEGSVRRVSNQVLVTVQLIDTQTDTHLWAENYNRALDDIFAIQADIAKEVARQLKTVISPLEVKKIEYRPTYNQVAYDYFLQARILADTIDGNWDKKTGLLEKAVALDPEFVEAWAWMAHEYSFWWYSANFSSNPDTRIRQKSLDAMDRAIRINPNLAVVHWAQSSLARNIHGNVDKAIGHLVKAIDEDPGFQHARSFLGIQLLLTGRLPEAQTHLEFSVSADPLVKRWVTNLLDAYQLRGMWKEARSLIETNLKRGGEEDYWNYRLAQVEFRETGDKRQYINALTKNKEFMASFGGKAWMALESRDYLSVLRFLNDDQWGDETIFYPYPLASRCQFLGLARFHRFPYTSLIRRELGDIENSTQEAESFRVRHENRMENDPLSPRDWARLAVCYALLREENKIEPTIDKVRESLLTSSSKYSTESLCEALIATAYILQGNHEKAIVTLEAATMLENHFFLNRELNHWFIFDQLHGNPRFDALLK